MSLVLDDRQLLLPGVRQASLEEIDERFARFQRSDRLFGELAFYH